jgi:hypothetical protein
MSIPSPRSCALVIASLVCIHGFTAQSGATVINWSGTTGDFSDGTNWAMGIAPVAGDEAHIDNGGTALITGNQGVLFLILATATGQSGNVQMAAGSTLTTTSDIRIGNGATGGTGTINQSGGDVIMNGGNMNVGYGDTAVGTYALSGGTISINSATILAVGNRGTGTFAQSAGSVYVRGPLTGATTGTGQLNLGRNGAVGPTNPGTSSGTYTLSGGDFTAALLRYGNNAAGAATGSTNIFNLQGTGKLVVGTISIINTNAANSFNFTGGTLEATTIGLPITNNGGTLSPATLFFGNSTTPAPATASGVETSPVGTTTFTLANTYNQGSTGILSIDLAGPGSNDFVSIGADPTLLVTSSISGTIRVNPLFEPAMGSVFDILSADTVINSATIVGQTAAGKSFAASIAKAGDGRDVLRLTVVPEPGSVALLGGALGLLSFRRPRRAS